MVIVDKILEIIVGELGVNYLALVDREYKIIPFNNYFECYDCGECVGSRKKPTKRCSCYDPYFLNPKTAEDVEIINAIGKTWLPISGLPKGKWNPLEYSEKQEPLAPNKIYRKIINILKTGVSFKSDLEYKIVACWVMASWNSELYSTCGHLMFQSGEPNMGKTTATKILEKLCYRTVDGTKLTGREKYTLGEKHNCTVFLDNINSVTNDLTNYLDTSYKLLNGKTIFTAVNGIIQFCESTKQRMIPIVMPYGEAKEINRRAVYELQKALLTYRLQGEKPLKEVRSGLTGRLLELYTPILSTARFLKLDTKDIEQYAKENSANWESCNDNMNEMAILTAIKEWEKPIIFTTELLSRIGWDDTRETRLELGYKLKRMQIVSTKGRDKGKRISKVSNKEQLESLYKLYSIN